MIGPLLSSCISFKAFLTQQLHMLHLLLQRILILSMIM